ncbi:MAG: hypothetical protein AAF770_00260 [Bacteroidota bacterium]
MQKYKGGIYQMSPWLTFRNKILKLDAYRCVRCEQTLHNRSLQVHHKYYIQGRMPWEYPIQACLVLCRSCHAQYHGKIRPRKGWQYMGYHICKKGKEKCGNCATPIKHCYFLFHPQWGTLLTGEICCNQLTKTYYASSQKKKEKKRATYLANSKWIKTEKARIERRYKGRHIIIFAYQGFFFLKIDHRLGKKKFASYVQAKNHAFNIIQDGILELYEANQASSITFSLGK